MADETNSVTCGECRTVFAEAAGTAAEDRSPCPKCGSTARIVTVTLSKGGEVLASAELIVIGAPASAAAATSSMIETGYRVTWYAYPDGQYMVQVYDGNGKLIDGGGGNDPEEMILEVAERLLPGSS